MAAKTKTIPLTLVHDWTLPDWSVRTYTRGRHLVVEAERDAEVRDTLRQIDRAGWVAVGDPLGELVLEGDRPAYVQSAYLMPRRARTGRAYARRVAQPAVSGRRPDSRRWATASRRASGRREVAPPSTRCRMVGLVGS